MGFPRKLLGCLLEEGVITPLLGGLHTCKGLGGFRFSTVIVVFRLWMFASGSFVVLTAVKTRKLLFDRSYLG